MNSILIGFWKRVALRKESVDRNDTDVGIPNANTVALRKESVDRNIQTTRYIPSKRVALRKESVDRNLRISVIEYGTGGRSPQGERG